MIEVIFNVYDLKLKKNLPFKIFFERHLLIGKKNN